MKTTESLDDRMDERRRYISSSLNKNITNEETAGILNENPDIHYSMHDETIELTERLLHLDSRTLEKYINIAKPKGTIDKIIYFFDTNRKQRHLTAQSLLPVKIETEILVDEHKKHIDSLKLEYLTKKKKELQIAEANIYGMVPSAIKEYYQTVVEIQLLPDYVALTNEELKMKDAHLFLLRGKEETSPQYLANMARRSIINKIIIERKYDNLMSNLGSLGKTK